MTMAMDFLSTTRLVPNEPPSPVEVLAACLFVACLYICAVAYRIQRKRDARYPPFAPGNMWDHTKMALNSQYPWWLLDVSKRLNTRVFQISMPINPTVPFVVVSEPDTMRAVLTDPMSSRPTKLYRSLNNVYGASTASTMLTSNGKRWHNKRKAASPAFSSNHVKRMTRVALEKTDAWIQDTLAVDENDTTSFDCAEEMLFIVLTALAETGFEYSMSKEETVAIRQNINSSLIEFTRKSPSNPLRPYLWKFSKERRRACQAVKDLRAMVGKFMDVYRSKKDLSNTPGTIIQLVMDSDAFPTEEEKKAQLMEFMIAGHDTTAYTIS